MFAIKYLNSDYFHLQFDSPPPLALRSIGAIFPTQDQEMKESRAESSWELPHLDILLGDGDRGQWACRNSVWAGLGWPGLSWADISARG